MSTWSGTVGLGARGSWGGRSCTTPAIGVVHTVARDRFIYREGGPA
jgi:hypothetical protein